MVNVITRPRTAGIAIAGALLAFLAVASSAHATTYYACVKKKGGSIRLVSSVTNGATGFTSTLPVGATEKGTWATEIRSPLSAAIDGFGLS